MLSDCVDFDLCETPASNKEVEFVDCVADEVNERLVNGPKLSRLAVLKIYFTLKARRVILARGQ